MVKYCNLARFHGTKKNVYIRIISIRNSDPRSKGFIDRYDYFYIHISKYTYTIYMYQATLNSKSPILETGWY